MREKTLKSSGRECIEYESFEEILDIAVRPPKYCEADACELVYYSFYDKLERFTLKAFCRKCKRDFAVAVKPEKYQERKLHRWSELVKERAEFKCEMEDSKCSGALHAHHIIPKHLDPSKMYDVENGMCLCEAHHKMIHSYM